MSPIKKMIVTAFFIALGVLLPLAFHSIPNAGSVFLPIHIPILFCGIVCSFPYGLACGVITPLLSSLLTGMPSVAYLPRMLCELAVYGLITSLLMRYIRMKNLYAKVYIVLIGAMLAGRVMYGIASALYFAGGEYSMQIWITAAFVTALPGIIIQIVLIPALTFALQKGGFIALE